MPGKACGMILLGARLVVMGLDSRRNRRSGFVADLSQEALAPGDIFLPFNAFRRGAVHHAQDAAAQFGLGDQHLGRVGRGAEDMADFRYLL